MITPRTSNLLESIATQAGKQNYFPLTLCFLTARLAVIAQVRILDMDELKEKAVEIDAHIKQPSAVFVKIIPPPAHGVQNWTKNLSTYDRSDRETGRGASRRQVSRLKIPNFHMMAGQPA